MTNGALTEAQFQEWLSDAFKEDDDWRAEIKKYNDGVSKYMRGIDPKKHKEVKTMFHKDLIERLTTRIENLETDVAYLKKVSVLRYWFWSTCSCRDIPVTDAIQKICDHLKIDFHYMPAENENFMLKSKVLPKKPKKKAKKKK